MLLLRDEFIISRFPPCICPLAKAGGPGREGGGRPQRRRRPGDLRNHRAPSRGRGHDYLLISAAERRVSVEPANQALAIRKIGTRLDASKG